MLKPIIAYCAALAAVVAAILLRWLFDPLMGDTLPLVTLFGAVAIAVWLGGYRPAVLAAVIGYVACAYLFIEPRGRLGLDVPQNAVGLLAYLFTCAVIVGFAEAMRRAQHLAELRRETLQVTLTSMGDAVITTDTQAIITSLNSAAESLTGWALAEAVGQPLDEVFRIINEQSRNPTENPAKQALRNGVTVGLANHTVLIRKDGSEVPIDDSSCSDS